MDAISQTTFSNEFSRIKMLLSIIWTNDGYFTDAYMRRPASMS